MYEVVITNCYGPHLYKTESLFKGSYEECEEYCTRLHEDGFQATVVEAR